MSMIKYKKVNKSSGITVPKDLRHTLGIMPGMAVDLVETEEGMLVRKHVPTCTMCGCIENVIEHRGFEVCKGCIGEMAVK